MKDLTAYVGYFTGIVLFVIGIYLVRIWRPEYDRCRKIILDAEKRILSEGIAEPEPPLETTNISSPPQENSLSKRGNIGQIEYIKAKLDLHKLIISTTLGAIFLIAVYNIQSSGSNFIPVMFAMVLLGILVVIISRKYTTEMNELKDLS